MPFESRTFQNDCIHISEYATTELLLDEKNGLFNRITVEDTNQALDKLIDEETDKAVADGLLDKAQTNAKDMITNLFKGVCSASGYKLLPVKFE